MGKQQWHLKDRQADLTRLAGEESPTSVLVPPPSRLDQEDDGITNKSIRQRTEAAEIQGLDGDRESPPRVHPSIVITGK